MLTTWRIYCQHIESPDLFIDFGWWSLVSACLGRKVWIGDDKSKLHLNTYTAFVAEPGVGKSRVLDKVKYCLMRVKANGEFLPEDLPKDLDEPRMMAVPLGPDAASKASLVRELSNLGTSFFYKGVLVPHASMTVCLSEMASLFRGYDPIEVVGFLTGLFDCQPYRATTISRGKESIMNGCLTIIAATNPKFMMTCHETSILDEGMAARTWFLWADRPRFKNVDSNRRDEAQEKAERKIYNFIYETSKLVGPISLTDEAKAYLKNWYEDDFNSERHNKSKKLAHYYDRKLLHVQKLAALIAISENSTLDQQITDVHVASAFRELKRIEMQMDVALVVKPRNELFNMHSVITDFVSLHPTISLDETYKQVAEFANLREYIDTLITLSKVNKLRFVEVNAHVELTTNLDQKRVSLTKVMNALAEYETNPKR